MRGEKKNRDRFFPQCEPIAPEIQDHLIMMESVQSYSLRKIFL